MHLTIRHLELSVYKLSVVYLIVPSTSEFRKKEAVILELMLDSSYSITIAIATGCSVSNSSVFIYKLRFTLMFRDISLMLLCYL